MGERAFDTPHLLKMLDDVFVMQDACREAAEVITIHSNQIQLVVKGKDVANSYRDDINNSGKARAVVSMAQEEIREIGSHVVYVTRRPEDAGL